MRRRLSTPPYTQVLQSAQPHHEDRDADKEQDTGQPVFLPFRMSCFVLTNLVVTAGMLTPGLGVREVSNPT
jgi:hypothetical protein